ncbi:MAG: hypothetical protein WDN50_13560 [Bradyrhizobium sp.]
MTSKMYAALVASVGAVALVCSAGESSARTGTASRAFTPAHSISHPAFAHSLRHSRRRNAGLVWGTDSYDYGSPDGTPLADDGTAPASGDVHYTTTYDVPWDWAHRFPPNVTPADKPYVPSCPTQVVTVPGRNGNQNVNVTQCF